MTTFYTNVETFGSTILYRGIHDGKQFFNKVEYKPTLYVQGPQREDSKLSLEGDCINPIHFSSIKEARDFIDRYEDVDNFKYYGMENWPFAFIADEYKGDIDYDADKIRILLLDIETRADGGFPDPILAAKEITAITLFFRNTYYIFGCGDYAPHRSDIVYKKCEDEAELLNRFLLAWEAICPDIVSGWNSQGFDITYIVNRIKIVIGKEAVRRLSPWKIVRERTYTNTIGKEVQTYTIYGVASLDYLDMFRKFSNRPQESYRLGNVGHNELGLSKIDYSDYANLDQLYLNDFQRYVEYNMRDVEILVKLDEKFKLFALALNLAYSTKTNYVDIFKQTKMWDGACYNFLLEEGVIVPGMDRRNSESGMVGGFVMEPIPGMYEWFTTLDMTSFYPHLIMHYNISPETRIRREQLMNWQGPKDSINYFLKRMGANDLIMVDIEKLINKEDTEFTEHLVALNLTMTANGCLFRRDKIGFAPRLIDITFKTRKKFKDLMLEAKSIIKDLAKTDPRLPQLTNDAAKYRVLQETKKVAINAFFGASANAGFRFAISQHAEAITTSGQMGLRWNARKLNEWLSEKFGKGQYVIYADTDSITVTLKALIEKFGITDKKTAIETLEKFAREEIQPMLEVWMEEMRVYMNAPQQKLFMKLEKIGDKCIFTGKKRYILNIGLGEYGYLPEPQISITGIEAIRSSTPEYCRGALNTVISYAINKTERETQDFIAKFHDEFVTRPFEEIAFPRGVNDIEKWVDYKGNTKPSTPIQVRASVVYNSALKEYGLDKKYETIKSGEKIKFAYLKLPNPLDQNVIACSNKLPKEFGLEVYIDYELQFSKAFLNPLQNLLGAINWRSEEIITLDDFC
jgi:DNA polymerase elongation subunit (family B)